MGLPLLGEDIWTAVSSLGTGPDCRLEPSLLQIAFDFMGNVSHTSDTRADESRTDVSWNCGAL